MTPAPRAEGPKGKLKELRCRECNKIVVDGEWDGLPDTNLVCMNFNHYIHRLENFKKTGVWA